MAAHITFKRALAELLVTRPAADGFAEALAQFAIAVEQQRSLDRDRLIPALRSAMDVHQRRALCNDIELLFETGAPPAADVAPDGSESSPQDLIEQAEVVLSSLAARFTGGDQPASA